MKTRNTIKASCRAAAILFTLGITTLNAGSIRFMEANECGENQKGECEDKAGTRIDFKKTEGFTNDDARSVTLLNVRKGAIIRVYDNPEGKEDDDYAEIVVKKEVQSYCVKSFENTYEDDTVKVTFHKNNGLDGKVSRVEVD